MRQGITTKYLGPTNSTGSRVKATYYLKDACTGIELRQTRFRSLPKDHPHDVCAVGRTKEEVLGMYDQYLSGGVEGEREA